MWNNNFLFILAILSRPYYTSSDYVGYIAADGNCYGNDLLDGPLYSLPEDCAAKCTTTPECVGWVYIFLDVTNQLLPCYLKDVMCWSPIIESSITYKSYFKIPTEVAGYKRVDGDCWGNDIKWVHGSPEECAAHCTSIPECVGLVYIIGPSARPYPSPCALKRKMCEKPIITTIHIKNSYFKIINQEMTVFQEASEISLTSTPGLAATLMHSKFECARKCHRDADCTYFSVSENGGKYTCEMTSSVQLSARPPSTQYYKKQSVIKS